MIRITDISFKNFRQYKDFSIRFESNYYHNLHVLVAKNGTGKTTFLNGILWCLYGDERNITDKQNAQSIVNNSVKMRCSNGDNVEVVARISIEEKEEDTTIIFERKQMFKISVENTSNGVVRHAIGSPSQSFKVTTIKKKGGKELNPQFSKSKEEADAIVKQYFDGDIYKYYFFDGESLKDYFNKSEAGKIKTAVYNISQVTLLNNIEGRINKLMNEKSKASAAETRELTKLRADRDDLNLIINYDEEQLNRSNENAANYSKERERCQKQLRDSEFISKYVKDRDSLNDQLKSVTQDEENLGHDIDAFIAKYLPCLRAYPYAKKTYELIKQKEKDKCLPPLVDKEQIQSMIDRHKENCPICGTHIDENIIAKLEELLQTLDITPNGARFLMKIEPGLNEIIERVEKEYKDKNDEFNEREKKIRSKIKDLNKQLEDIHSILSKWPVENDYSTQIAQIEADYESADKLLITELATAKNLANQIGVNQKRLEAINKRIGTEEKKLSFKNLAEKEYMVYKDLEGYFNLVKEQIVTDLKAELIKKTWDFFDAMIWKKKTFSHICISDNYELSVYSKSGEIMTGTTSATEFMALAYAFTLAIHDASGKNCPLVVDSPLGRVSDDNRYKMAEQLLNVSERKQIIMLFTPDEFSPSVRKLYEEGSISSYNELVLASDEETIMGIGEGE